MQQLLFWQDPRLLLSFLIPSKGSYTAQLLWHSAKPDTLQMLGQSRQFWCNAALPRVATLHSFLLHSANPDTLQMEYLRPLTISILSERRALRPYGLLGGHAALPGLNLLIHADGRTVNLGAKNSTQAAAGDRVRIYTPGALQLKPRQDYCSSHPVVTQAVVIP